MKKILLLAALACAGGCGYKGSLYLPKEHDNNRFGAIQTGLDFTRPQPASAPSSESPHDPSL